MPEKTFTIISRDDSGVLETPDGILRLLCRTQLGQTICIYGDGQLRANIDVILNATLPCVVIGTPQACASRQISRYGYDLWFPINSRIRLVGQLGSNYR